MISRLYPVNRVECKITDTGLIAPAITNFAASSNMIQTLFFRLHLSSYHVLPSTLYLYPPPSSPTLSLSLSFFLHLNTSLQMRLLLQHTHIHTHVHLRSILVYMHTQCSTSSLGVYCGERERASTSWRHNALKENTSGSSGGMIHRSLQRFVNINFFLVGFWKRKNTFCSHPAAKPVLPAAGWRW